MTKRNNVTSRLTCLRASKINYSTGRSLILLRQHPVLGLEVLSGKGDELPVARMIDRFHAGNHFHQLRIVLINVLDQFVLSTARPGDENSAGVRDRFGGCVEEIVILGGVPAADGVCLVVDVPRRVIRVQHQPFDIGRAEMEHAGFTVIDPDDRMIVMRRHGMGLLSIK